MFDALDALCWGVAHYDVALIDEAHIMIENLRREHTQHPDSTNSPATADTPTVSECW